MTSKTIRRLVVVLIKNTKYDKDGYLIQFMRGVLPCNTLAAMWSLTLAAFTSSELAGLDCQVVSFDETTMSRGVNPRRIMKQYAGPDTRVVVGLVGVQTNMFTRARQLALQFKDLGAAVVMGGFHVSGSITMMHDGNDPQIPSPRIMPPECAELMERGVTIFHGEAEASWAQVLGDIVRGDAKPLYRGGRPALATAPLPEYPPRYFDGFFGKLHTFDTGRGCPFKCSFCTIINVQGHDPRYRSVEAIVNRIRAACHDEGEPFFFFTDDNFARNPYWKDILTGLMRLRQNEGLQFSFMIEADLAAWKLKGFVELLAAAGCTHVFMGVETVRQETLQKARKGQNRVSTYAQMTGLYHSFGIVCHAGFILGFPADTPGTIAEDVETLKELGFDQASFFIMIPIPGSEDHIRYYMAGVPMDQNLNDYDSFQPVMDHPLMSRREWQAAYNRAWHQFYTADQMIAALSRIAPGEFWSLFRNFIWYRWSAIVENVHPMMAGFGRHKHLASRDPSAPRRSYVRHLLHQASRLFRYFGLSVREYLIFQQVYFGSRYAISAADAGSKVRWFNKTFGRAAHREWLNAFWQRYARLQWRLLLPQNWVWHLEALAHTTTEIVYAVRFNTTLISLLLHADI